MSDSNQSLLEYLKNRQVSLPEKTVYIEEWGREVTLRGLTARERDMWEEDHIRRSNAASKRTGQQRASDDLPDMTNFRARLVSRHIVHNGMRVFANQDGIDELGRQPAKVIDKLFAISQALSGFSDADVEELTKNLKATGDGEHSSDSATSGESPSHNSNASSPNGSS